MEQLLVIFVAVLRNPREAFEAIDADEGYGTPLRFVALMGVASAALTTMVEWFRPVQGGLQLGLGSGVIGRFAGHLVLGLAAVWVVGLFIALAGWLAGGGLRYRESVVIACYGSAVWPLMNALSFNQWLSGLPAIYGLVIVGAGIAVQHRASGGRVFAALGSLTFVGLAALGGATWLLYRSVLTLSKDHQKTAQALLPQVVAPPAKKEPAPPRPTSSDEAPRPRARVEPVSTLRTEPDEDDDPPRPLAPGSLSVAPEPAVKATPVPKPVVPQIDPHAVPAGPAEPVSVDVYSVPSGAQVSLPNGARLGTTPFIWHTDSHAAVTKLHFTRAGYQPLDLDVDANMSARVSPALKPVESTAPPVSKKPPPKSRKH